MAASRQKRPRKLERDDTKQQGDAHVQADTELMEAKPDWDRMGEIADRLLSTPPDRQAVGKALAPKQRAKRVK